MPFGIPSEDFRGGFGLPQDKGSVIDVRTKEQKKLDAIEQDDYNTHIGEYTDLGFGENWVSESPEMPDEDREAAEAAQEAHDNLIRSLIEAGGEIREAKMLLVRALDQLYLLGYDSGFTNPAIEQLVTDIKFYLSGGRLNGS